MDKVKNGGLWCAAIALVATILTHSTIWPDGSLPVKILVALSQAAGGLGSLFFGPGVAAFAKADKE
jgi:hypothetical protein